MDVCLSEMLSNEIDDCMLLSAMWQSQKIPKV